MLWELPLFVLLAQLSFAAMPDTSSAQEIEDWTFTYQGRLLMGGAAVNGQADLQFTLWRDAQSTESADRLGGVRMFAGHPVSDGLFQVELDFGPDAFDGSPRWLEIAVRVPAGDGEFVALSPRQRVRPVPYALATRGIYVDRSGRVGVGTTTPQALLSVEGVIATSGGVRFADGTELRSATGTSAGAVYDVAHYGIEPGGTDNSSRLARLLRLVHERGGGTIVFREGVYRLNGRLDLPNDGNGDFRLPATQKPIRITGAGAMFSGQGWAPNGGTVLELAYSGSPARILTTGDGLLQIDNVTLASGSASATPILMTTNTTLLIRACAFYGSLPAPDCLEDAIVLGGTTNLIGNSLDAPFQGYGTIIEGNYFSRIRRGVYLRSYGNAVVIRDNTWWRTSGGALGSDEAVAIESLGHSLYEYNAGCLITGNLIETTYYKYAIRLDRTTQFSIMGNNFYDGDRSVYLQAYYWLGPNARGNLIIDGFFAELAPPRATVVDLSPGQVNTRITSHGNQLTTLGASNLKVTNGYTVGLGTDPQPGIPLLVNAGGGGGENLAIKIHGGASTDGYSMISGTPAGAYLHGGQIQFGAWDSSDRGVRLIGLDSAGQPRAAVHCNAAAGQVGIIGDLALLEAGSGLRLPEGPGARMGVVELAGTSPVAVPCAAVTAASRIFLTINDRNGSATVGTPYVVARSPGNSFAVASTERNDRSRVAWLIIEPK